MEWYCDECKFIKVRDEMNDAYFCLVCNKWKEKQCGDDECHFCVNRPENPMTKEEHLEAVEKFLEKMQENKTGELGDEKVPLDRTHVIDIINEVFAKNNNGRTVE